VVCAYYEQEYDKIALYSKNIETSQKSAYSVIKTLMQLRFFSADEVKAGGIYGVGKLLPDSLLYANEILCWNVLMYIYDDFIKAKQSQHQTLPKEYAPYCVFHKVADVYFESLV